MITTWYNKYITGRHGLLAEMAERAYMEKPITHSWFRRCCRRNGVGSIETRNWLYDELIVNSRVFPLRFEKPIEFHTYSQWQLRGYQVMKDEQAAYQNQLGDQYSTIIRWWRNEQIKRVVDKTAKQVA